MRKGCLLLLLGCVSTALMAQRSPVGIVSVQDSVESVQVDAISDTDSTMALPPAKHPWRALAEITAINAAVHLYDRYVTREDFAQTTLRSIRRNFTDGLVWDNDLFHVNMFLHPYHGNLYFNVARTNGMTFWESVPYALFGSAMWEFFGEADPPAVNDLIATTCGGMALGEMTHRLSLTVLDDRDRGFNRFLREALATVINPIQGIHRIVSGDAWRVKSRNYRYHDFRKTPLEASVSVGWRYLADNDALSQGDHTPYVNLMLAYGTPVDGEKHTTPFDFFDIETNLVFGSGQPIVNTLNIVGRLWSTPILDKKDMVGEFGIYQHFNYYDAKSIVDDSDLIPYRISEAAAFGPGVIFSLSPGGDLSKMEQRLFLSGILLGGTKSDHFNILDRNYNMGSGFSLKSKTQFDFGKLGRFVLNVKYFHLWTWVGYEDEDLDDYAYGIKDLRYLNAQGDNSNTALWVINPVVEIHLAKQWSVNLSGSYYGRRTHYNYYYDEDYFMRENSTVYANTFETKIGVTCRL